jgi:hypothetical protein
VFLAAAGVLASGIVAGSAQAEPRSRGIQVLGQNAPNGFQQDLHNFGPSYPFGRNYARPPAVTQGPVHQGARWVPGYWARQWVPQYQYYDVWVPAQYGGAGWIPGHYETQAVEAGGYYQQVWIDGHWD